MLICLFCPMCLNCPGAEFIGMFRFCSWPTDMVTHPSCYRTTKVIFSFFASITNLTKESIWKIYYIDATWKTSWHVHIFNHKIIPTSSFMCYIVSIMQFLIEKLTPLSQSFRRKTKSSFVSVCHKLHVHVSASGFDCFTRLSVSVVNDQSNNIVFEFRTLSWTLLFCNASNE